MTWNSRTERWLHTAAGFTAAAACLLATAPASAEITVAKGETWEAYVAGRLGAFVSYTFGDAYPVPKVAGSMLQPGGGLDAATPPRDVINEKDAMGKADPTKQGKIKKIRVRSGYYPNIMTLGARKTVGPSLKLKFQLSMWGTIEPDDTKGNKPPEFQPANGTRDNSIKADFREGYLQAFGGWGSFTGGRFLGTFARGLTEIDVMYAHGYGAGFPNISRGFGQPAQGDLTLPGPMGGMNGFGMVGATYEGGGEYTTPSLGGVKLALGLYDGSSYLSAGWGATRTPRPEAELTYDLDTSGFKLHLFGSGGFQKVYQASGIESSSVWGAAYGARIEVGPVRVGGGGFTGKGVGINNAFDDNPSETSTSTMRSVTDPATGMVTMASTYEFRPTSGFMGILQLVLGPVDIGGGIGLTTISQLAADKTAAATLSTLKSQTGITAEATYHVNESLHLGLDFFNGAYKWTGGETQKLNVINGGVTVTF